MRLKASLLNLFFPNRCPGCGKVLTAAETMCTECGEHTLIGQDDYCHFCGKESCVCKYHKRTFDRVVVACRYADEARRAVLAMKDSKNTNFAYFSAELLANRVRHGEYYGTFDCVMPVPMHPSKIRMRGYNQAALLGREVARLLDIPYREDVLTKERGGTEQHTLGGREREKNVESFGIRDVSLTGMRVLLCDDVLTTGATLNRCAALLKEKGAAFVVAAAATSTPPKDKDPDEVEHFLHGAAKSPGDGGKPLAHDEAEDFTNRAETDFTEELDELVDEVETENFTSKEGTEHFHGKESAPGKEEIL